MYGQLHRQDSPGKEDVARIHFAEFVWLTLVALCSTVVDVDKESRPGESFEAPADGPLEADPAPARRNIPDFYVRILSLFPVREPAHSVQQILLPKTGEVLSSRAGRPSFRPFPSQATDGREAVGWARDLLLGELDG